MASGIFSVYKAPENRVTAAVLSVLGSLALSRTERLLGALLQRSDFQLVEFRNQPAKGGKGVPDCEIVSSVRLLVETKIVRDAVDIEQLRRHLERFEAGGHLRQFLLVLTPDDGEPAQIAQTNDSRVAWASFSALFQGIEELLADHGEVTSERESFLLRELQALLAEPSLGLMEPEHDTLVVAAKNAWPEYLKFGCYVCQADRPFRRTKYFGFYSEQAVQPRIGLVLARHEAVELRCGIGGELGQAVDAVLAAGAREEGEVRQVFLLSRDDDPRTVVLPAAIPNDVKTSTGRGWAFVLGQTYVALEDLLIAKKTSDLRRQR